ncbi:hypothetical protein [Hymenobacter sp. IS2118]|uniref:hypothetical protein n=1 Tax=Hymenobacter sp. IS2118 TaxID=1505605 RepID=UPI0005564588|nr:hypothetical protein [Hymenobacter sp. IS2118]
MKLIVIASLVACRLFWGSAAAGQTAPAPIAPAPKMVLVTINWWGNLLGTPFLGAAFDTDGETIGGLSQKELNQKFAKIPLPASSASIINFVVRSGYRVVSFNPTQGGAGTDTNRVSVTNGYVLLCEKLL